MLVTGRNARSVLRERRCLIHDHGDQWSQAKCGVTGRCWRVGRPRETRKLSKGTSREQCDVVFDQCSPGEDGGTLKARRASPMRARNKVQGRCDESDQGKADVWYLFLDMRQ